MTDRFTHDYRRSSLEYMDLRIARFFSGLDADSGSLVPWAFALTSHATSRGHVCLDLAHFTRPSPTHESIASLDLPDPVDLDELLEQLHRHPAVGRAGQRRPFILDDAGRLYLFRYWQYENSLAEEILAKAASHTDITDISRFKDGLTRLFPNDQDHNVLKGQGLAATVACLKPFCVISGGPGTGKTSLISKILALQAAQRKDTGIRVCLTAPTGKAAARLSEALIGWASKLNTAGFDTAAIPTTAQTIHRTLGSRWGSSDFRYHATQPLPADLVVVDEASMVDMGLMAKLVRAIPARARLILLGDRHQLASVEPGAVFGDICPEKDAVGISRHLHNAIREITGRVPEAGYAQAANDHPVADSIVTLTHSYRFSATNGIGRLAHAVKEGDVAAVTDILEHPGNEPAVTWIHGDADALPRVLADHLLEGFRGYLTTSTPEKALEMFNRFRVLCATMAGPRGVTALNDLAFRVLQVNGLIPPGNDIWYPGRPILITRNDYHLNLFNGDLGIVCTEPLMGHRHYRTCFPGPSGSVRRIATRMISSHETAFAMTVHKSQGSECDAVLVILPGQDSPLLTRELLYTAVTRARKHVILCGERHILAAALRRRVERSSGLRDALWG